MRHVARNMKNVNFSIELQFSAHLRENYEPSMAKNTLSG